MSANRTKFFQFSTNSADSHCRANQLNQQEFLTPKDFHFFFLEIIKALHNNALQVIRNVWIWGPVQEDIEDFYQYFISWQLLLFSSIKPSWFMFFLLISYIAKSVLIVINDKPGFNLLILWSFLNFRSIPGIYSEEIIRGIGGNFEMLKICDFLT